MAGIAANHAQAVDRFGVALAGEIYAFTLDTHRLLAEALSGRAEYRRRGSWRIAASEQEALELERSEQLLREQGFAVTFAGGRLFTPADGELDPAAAVATLAAPYASAIRLGVAIDTLETSASGVRVTAAGTVCVADRVILATNAYTAQLLPAISIRPVRGQMLATAPVAQTVAERPSSADRGFQYWRQRADGRVLVGGYRNLAVEQEVGYDQRPTVTIQRQLERHLRGLGVREPITHRWAGIMGFSEDELPLVGPVPGMRGVYVCGAYTGHGWAFAFQAARLLAALLRGGDACPPWLDPARFAPAASG
jgi:glycine/D-amino acid oxidase-like deaminating enzyme